jgi:hypothetical protein
MHKTFLVVVVLLLWFAATLSASAITYDITVDTSSISGTAGSLDFQFNPGPLTTQLADLQILGFTSDGALAGSPSLTGDVSGGPLPSSVMFDNGTGYNDYFEGFTYGDSISFQVSLYGPALTSPDGTSTSGSTFAFGMFSDSAGTDPTLTSDTIDGFAFTVDVNLDGTTTLTNFSSETAVSPVSAVPEPSSLLFLGSALASFIVVAPRRKKAGSS